MGRAVADTGCRRDWRWMRLVVTLILLSVVLGCLPARSEPPPVVNPLGFGDQTDADGTRFEVRDPDMLLFSFRLAATSARVFDEHATPLGRVAQRDGQGWQLWSRDGHVICDAPASTFGLLLSCGAEGSADASAATTEITLQQDGSVRVSTAGAPTIELTGDPSGEAATLRYLPDGAEWRAQRNAESHRVEIHSPEGDQWTVFPDRLSALAALALVVPPPLEAPEHGPVFRTGLAWRVHRWERERTLERLRQASSSEDEGSDGSAADAEGSSEGSQQTPSTPEVPRTVPSPEQPGRAEGSAAPAPVEVTPAGEASAEASGADLTP